MNKSTIVIIVVAAFTSTAAFADSIVEEIRMDFQHRSAWIEIMRDVSTDCKTDIQIYGREAATRFNCQTYDRYMKDSSGWMPTKFKDADIDTYAKVINGHPDIAIIMGMFSQITNNVKYITIRSQE